MKTDVMKEECPRKIVVPKRESVEVKVQKPALAPGAATTVKK